MARCSSVRSSHGMGSIRGISFPLCVGWTSPYDACGNLRTPCEVRHAAPIRKDPAMWSEGEDGWATGCSQGIGAAYARAMAKEGADVAIIDLKRIDQAKAVEDDITALGRRALTL